MKWFNTQGRNEKKIIHKAEIEFLKNNLQKYLVDSYSRKK